MKTEEMDPVWWETLEAVAMGRPVPGVSELGGKASLAKKIAAYLESVRPEGATFFDVFTGGANVVSAMSGPRVANDACKPLITLYRSWLEGWRPPETVDEDLYYWTKIDDDPEDPITAFVGFGCSYGGKYFGGFARDPKNGRNFAQTAVRGLDRKMQSCAGVRFENVDFEDLEIEDASLVYLDPPYRDSTRFGFFGGFDHDRFDRWALELSKRCVVVLSEYAAPEPWRCVREFEVRKSRFKGRQKERLFEVRT